MRTEEIEIEKIVIPEQRARASFDQEQHEALVASIKTHGFSDPILVREIEHGKYELIDGEHRLNIARDLGYEKVPANVVDADDRKAIMLNILSNAARGVQNPMDIAEMLKQAQEKGATEDELAAAMGHTKSWIKLYLTLNDLPDHYKDALRSGKLKVGHIQETMKLMDTREIDAALQSVLVHGWSVKVLGYYVQERLRVLGEAKAKGELEKVERPPEPEEAVTMVQYADCMGCRQKVEREKLRMPTLCEDCYTLIEYCTTQMGTPKEAMDLIFRAVNMYLGITKQQRVQPTPQQPQPQLPQPQMQPQIFPQKTSPQSQVFNPAQQQPQTTSLIGTFSQEDLELFKKIKLLKDMGIL